MSEWVELALNVFVAALAVTLLVKFRDRGVLRRIGESKRAFRTWVKGQGS
jgi:hypothetical protein